MMGYIVEFRFYLQLTPNATILLMFSILYVNTTCISTIIFIVVEALKPPFF